ncbi:MAG: winged helix-turn-helix transcriptional regulator [archaeon GBS-70-058]|nr:winged helix-turn-helix transcriptional regulator [Candidatus Culexarchaeum nevadense]
MSITLSPIGREDIKNLETALLIETLFRKDVLEALKDPSQRITWLTSLGIAAGALAREKAKMTIRQIAEELGISEATVRSHLTGKTKAGQLVRETYEKFLKEGVTMKSLEILLSKDEINNKINELENTIEELKKKLEELKNLLK